MNIVTRQKGEYEKVVNFVTGQLIWGCPGKFGFFRDPLVPISTPSTCKPSISFGLQTLSERHPNHCIKVEIRLMLSVLSFVAGGH